MDIANSSTFKRVLIETGLFSEPDADLREHFDLKTSGREAFLLASYGAEFNGYYLYDEERLLDPIGEDQVFQFPWMSFSVTQITDLKLRDAEGYGSRRGFRYNTVGGDISGLARRDHLLIRSLFDDEKYLKTIPIDATNAPQDYLRVRSLVEESRKSGIKPSNVLVLLQDPLQEEGFYEYLAGVELRKRNYLVTKSPLRIGLTADIYGYRAREFMNGAFLMEVSLGLGDIAAGGNNENSAALVEAKRSATDFGRGVQQALRYLSQASGYYAKGFLSAPYIDDISNQATGLGIITHDREGKIKFKDAPVAPDSAQQSEVILDANGLLNLARKRSKMTFDGRLVINI